MTGGRLHGARYLDIGWSDLQKAARSYKSDPRFNQFAKRAVAERAVGQVSSAATESAKSQSTWRQYLVDQIKAWGGWLLVKAKMKVGSSLVLALLLLIIFTRPLFYTVVAKTAALGIQVMLRRTVGFIIMMIDAILDEAASSLESALIAGPPGPDQTAFHTPQHELLPPRTFHQFFTQGLFTILGVLIGHRLPRAGRIDRNAPPTRLRVV